MNKNELAKVIEHTALKPTLTALDIENLCSEAIEWGFFGVCIQGTWIQKAVHILTGTGIKIISVAGFPLGANDTLVKCKEVEIAFSLGAHEIDVVLKPNLPLNPSPSCI